MFGIGMSRALIIISAVAVIALVGCTTQYQLPASDAEAIGPFAWCADVGGDVGTVNCGFVTLEQCRANVIGIGGQCYPNPERGVAEQKPPRPE
jgi:hypothetical protein